MNASTPDSSVQSARQGRPVHSTVLAARQPFDFACSVRAMIGFAPCAAELSVSGQTVRRAFAPRADRALLAEVDHAPGGVRLTVYAENQVSTDESAWIERAVARWLSLDDDLEPFLAIAASDLPVATLLKAARGLHQVRFPSLAEGLCYFVLTQRTSQRSAATRKRRLAARFGPRIEVDGEEFIAFPPLEALAGTGAAELRQFSANDSQAERLASALLGVAEIGAEWLANADYDQARKALLGISGVGEFTASAILLRVFGRPDMVPLEMPVWRDLIARVYTDGTTPDDLRRRYGRHIGTWAYTARTALSWTSIEGTAEAHRPQRR